LARGLDVHNARKAAVSALGRDLSRRARSKCEVCGEGGRLTVLEVPPVEEDPSTDRAVLACDRCCGLPGGGMKRVDANTLRFLGESMWSEVLPAQLMSVRLVRALAETGVPWAQEAADGLWLDEEVEALV